MQMDGVADTGLGGAGEKDDTLGKLYVASHTEGMMVNVENMGSEQIDDVRDLEDDPDAEGDAAAESDARPSSPIPAKAPTYLDGRIQYVCPVPLCVKTYQTLNGFRYHERQGTCVTKDGEPCTRASRGVTASKALVAVRTKADNESFLPRRPPARHSARLSALSTAEDIPAATGPTTRGSVKARSKAKGKSKPKPKLKSTAKSSATARAASPSPSRFSSPLSSYYAPDLDSDADTDDVAGD
ncbi:hypothetical protein K438DRAFT_1846965 [Mycena galopus ATCC 62051]|nr:hypothetical protein K438DRAFT_1846965 [Mycena galopus ATCC 62051]